MENKIKTITQEEAGKVIEDRKPLGLFLLVEGGKYIGIDNSNGEAWTEEFDSRFKCWNWLNGKSKLDNVAILLLLKQLKAPIFFDLENLKDSRDTPEQFNKTFELLKGNVKDLFDGIYAEGTSIIETISRIVGGLMDVIEEGLPEYYFSSDFIAECDDLLKELEK